ncbi:MAG TPA: hypothetical protein VN154_08945, partial [Rhizomicrobium sp.]|nr:hypothetical protein [Rhizomicrobium sp.]
QSLLVQAKPFASHIGDFRLGLEVSVIQRLAESLNRGLMHKDPLSQRVHHGKGEMLSLALAASLGFLLSPHRKSAARPALSP